MPLDQHQRLMIVLLVAASLLLMQVSGLHFHVHQSAMPGLHAEYVETHASCTEQGCGVDLSVAAFIKKLDQGWDVFAPALAVLLAWPLLRRRRYRRPPAVACRPAPPGFLRPLLRAPPLNLAPRSR